jgi:hypothetical protein
MKAIFTKSIGPTNTRPARIKAYDGDNSRMWSKDDLFEATCDAGHWRQQVCGLHLSCEAWMGERQNIHYEAARRFVAAMKWDKADGSLVTLAGGGTKEGYVWVMLD